MIRAKGRDDLIIGHGIVCPVIYACAVKHNPLKGIAGGRSCEMIKSSRPLFTAVQRTSPALISSDVRSQLLHADRCLCDDRHEEAVHYLKAGILGCKRAPELMSLVWMLLGSAHVSLGNYQTASVCHVHHLACCRDLGDFPGITKAECNLGLTYARQGLFQLSERCFLQYLENSRRLQDQNGISEALNNLGILSKMVGLQIYQESVRNTLQGKMEARRTLSDHLKKAIDYLEQHLYIEEDLNNLERQARAYGNLGWCYQVMRKHPQAIFCQTKSLDLWRLVGDRAAETSTLCHLANCLRATGRLQESIQYYTLSLELNRASGNRQGESVCLVNLGTTCEMLDQLDKAIEYHTLYLSAKVETGCLLGQARALSTLAGIYEESNQMMKAHDHYRKLVVVFGSLRDKKAQHVAKQLVQQTRLGAQKEKQHSIKESKKTFKILKSSPRRANTRTVSCSTVYRLPEPRKRRSAKSNKAEAQQEHSPSHSASPPTSLLAQDPASVEEDLEWTVFENPGTQHRTHCQPVHEQLVTEKTSLQSLLHLATTERKCPARDVTDEVCCGVDDTATEPRPLPQSPPSSATESLTSFETVVAGTDEPICPAREAKKNFLQENAHSLSQSVSELDHLEPDIEWEQWLHLQGTTESSLCSQVFSSLDIELGTHHTRYYWRSGSRVNSLSADTWCSHHTSDPHDLHLNLH